MAVNSYIPARIGRRWGGIATGLAAALSAVMVALAVLACWPAACF